MSNKTSVSTGGVGFLPLLALLFIALKLTGYITWSWWWVLAPLWGGLLLVIAIAGVVALFFAILWLIAIVKG